MGYSPWGRKELDMTELVHNSNNSGARPCVGCLVHRDDPDPWVFWPIDNVWTAFPRVAARWVGKRCEVGGKKLNKQETF